MRSYFEMNRKQKVRYAKVYRIMQKLKFILHIKKELSSIVTSMELKLVSEEKKQQRFDGVFVIQTVEKQPFLQPQFVWKKRQQENHKET